MRHYVRTHKDGSTSITLAVPKTLGFHPTRYSSTGVKMTTGLDQKLVILVGIFLE